MYKAAVSSLFSIAISLGYIVDEAIYMGVTILSHKTFSNCQIFVGSFLVRIYKPLQMHEDLKDGREGLTGKENEEDQFRQRKKHRTLSGLNHGWNTE